MMESAREVDVYQRNWRSIQKRGKEKRGKRKQIKIKKKETQKRATGCVYVNQRGQGIKSARQWRHILMCFSDEPEPNEKKSHFSPHDRPIRISFDEIIRIVLYVTLVHFLDDEIKSTITPNYSNFLLHFGPIINKTK